jgi:hypothetical protein
LDKISKRNCAKEKNFREEDSLEIYRVLWYNYINRSGAAF